MRTYTQVMRAIGKERGGKTPVQVHSLSPVTRSHLNALLPSNTR